MRLPKGLSVVKHQDLTIAQLYQTKIVVVNELTKTVTLNNGGWLTKHTKKCSNLILNQFGLSIVQRDFQWYVVKTDAKGRKSQVEYTNGLEVAYA